MDRLLARRALEALRAGVPNRDVTRLLIPSQPRAVKAFDDLLTASVPAEDAATAAAQTQHPGIVVAGGFGAGKSHLIEYFEQTALEQNFVCSRVVLSKETPLCDLLKVFRESVATALAPNRKGPALSEITADFHTDRAPGYRSFYHWAHRDASLDPRLPATLFLFENDSADEELREKIVAEWTGFPMKVSDLKAALKAHGEQDGYHIARPLKDQTYRRFEFLTRFFRAAGYSGWVILFDETELVSRYSLRQRGKSYAHLARLLGHVRGVGIPGLATAFAITDDYGGEVLRRINDIVKVPARMRMAGDPMVDEAEKGMAVLENRAIMLTPPTREQIGQTHARVRDLYVAAYGWEPPDVENVVEYAGSTRMRQYVRAWITMWDLRRLYDYHAELDTDVLPTNYGEDIDLQEDTERTQSDETVEVDQTPADGGSSSDRRAAGITRVPIPFHLSDEIATGGEVAFLHIERSPENGPDQWRGALFLLNAVGEPREFAYNRIALDSESLWRQQDRAAAAARRLTVSLLTGIIGQPVLLLYRADEIDQVLFDGGDAQMRPDIPTAGIAPCPDGQEGGDLLSSLASDGSAIRLRLTWAMRDGARPEPDSRAGRLLSLLAERGLLLEPFERASRGLREVYGENA